jgi:microsomal dipeptidase-like Zn-dependent dipeptidase
MTRRGAAPTRSAPDGAPRAALALVLAAALGGCVGDLIEQDLNRVYTPMDAPEVTPDELAAHEALFVADLHADTMLWTRDLLEEGDLGHLDLPRMDEGNVALQVFSVVTDTPPETSPPPPGARLIEERAANRPAYCLTGESINRTGLLQVAQLRPLRTWFDREKRALYQAERLKRFVTESRMRAANDPLNRPSLMMIYDAEDLKELVRRRQSGEPVVGALLALEGAHWLGEEEPDIEAGVDRLVAAGFRMLAPTHRFNNALGAASEGCDQLAGLTEAGYRFIERVEEQDATLDLAHLSDLGAAQAAAASDTPVVVSHTGVRDRCRTLDDTDPDLALCDVARGMRDEEIRAVARTGGVVGLGYWPEAVGRDVGAVVAAFVSAREVLSEPAFMAEMRAIRPDYDPVDHLAFGSDFDGAVSVPFDTSDLVWLTAALRREGSFDEAAIRKIAGANVCRVLALRLPDGSAALAEEVCAPLADQAPAPAVAVAGRRRL